MRDLTQALRRFQGRQADGPPGAIAGEASRVRAADRQAWIDPVVLMSCARVCGRSSLTTFRLPSSADTVT